MNDPILGGRALMDVQLGSIFQAGGYNNRKLSQSKPFRSLSTAHLPAHNLEHLNRADLDYTGSHHALIVYRIFVAQIAHMPRW